MVKPVLIIAGTIPVIFAILLIIPLTNPEIPITAIDPNDIVEIEFTKHHLTTVSFGITERLGAQQTGVRGQPLPQGAGRREGRRVHLPRVPGRDGGGRARAAAALPRPAALPAAAARVPHARAGLTRRRVSRRRLRDHG